MLEHFSNPPSEYRLHASWLWNSKPDPAEIERQIREMHSIGFAGFVIQQDSAYSDVTDANTLLCLERAARTASELRLQAFLHDKRHQFAHHWGQDYSKFLYYLRRGSICGSNNTLARENLRILAQFAEEPWATPLQDVKRAVDWQIAIGASTILAPCLRLSGGKRQFYEQMQWPFLTSLIHYAARLSYAMSQGRSKVQAALLEPSGDAAGFARQSARKHLNLFCTLLAEQHISFNLISEDALARATCFDQQLMVDGTPYEALVLPPLTRMGLAAAQKVREFAEDGGALVATGLIPYADADGNSREWIRDTFRHLFGPDPVELASQAASGVSALRRVVHQRENILLLPIADERNLKRNLRNELEKVVRPIVSARWRSAECKDILFAHRLLKDAELFFFANSSAQPRDVHLSIRCTGAPHVLDPSTGESYALPNCAQRAGRTLLLYRFEPYSSALLYFGPEPALTVRRQFYGIEGVELGRSDHWEVTSGVGGLRSVCVLTAHVPRLATGEALVVRTTGTAGVVIFKVNGEQVGVRTWAPYELDVSSFVKPGGPNHIQIEEIAIPNRPKIRTDKRVRIVIC